MQACMLAVVFYLWKCASKTPWLPCFSLPVTKKAVQALACPQLLVKMDTGKQATVLWLQFLMMADRGRIRCCLLLPVP